MTTIRPIVIGLGALIGSLAGCGTTATRITITPADARVFVNGQQICKASPCTWTTSFGLPHRAHLEIRRQGYKDLDLYIDPDMVVWMRVATRLALSYYLVPYLFAIPIEPFTYRMPKDLAFQLEPYAGATDPRAVDAAGGSLPPPIGQPAPTPAAPPPPGAAPVAPAPPPPTTTPPPPPVPPAPPPAAAPPPPAPPPPPHFRPAPPAAPRK